MHCAGGMRVGRRAKGKTKCLCIWKDKTNQSQKEKEKRGVNKRGGQRGVTAVRSNITSHFNGEETLRLSEGDYYGSVCGIKGFAACSAFF